MIDCQKAGHGRTDLQFPTDIPNWQKELFLKLLLLKSLMTFSPLMKVFNICRMCKLMQFIASFRSYSAH